jgi:hypothetical protein
VTTRFSVLALCVCLLGVRADARADDLLKNEVGPFTESVAQKLREKRFAELDALEQELQRTKARFTGGDWQLFHFYDALSGGRIPAGVAINADWLELIALLTEWRAQAPQSTVVSLLLADTYTGWAWHERGTGRANTVSEAKFAIFKDRLNQGAFYLNESRRVTANNPQWFYTALVIARGSGWQKERAATLFKQAVAVEPLYQHNYSAMAIFLLPRWYGDEGDWETFADEATASVGEQQGSAIYSHIVANVAKSFSSKEFFADNDLNWRRIQWSFADRERLYGPGHEALNSLCWLAGGVEDKTTARSVMGRIGDSWNQSVWRTRKNFDDYQQWLLVEP